MNFFSGFLSKKFLGIDIGTASIKMVELSGGGQKRQLVNYGEVEAKDISGEPFRMSVKEGSLSLSTKEAAETIKAIIEEAKIKTKDCIFSIPDFSSFFTNFELPPMSKEELSQAVFYEARQHIPLPLGEVALDWEIIEGEPSGKKQEKIKILLVAVPNEIINQYQEISRLSGLRPQALEAEAFGLARALILPEEKRIIAIIDIGAQSTTCSIIEKGILKTSYSFDFSGNDLIQKIANAFNIDYQKAQELKQKYGLKDVVFEGKKVREILLPSIDTILNEMKRINYNFYQTEGKEIQKFILAGGTSLLPGMREYFEAGLQKEVVIADPFANISYPPILEQTLKEMGPSFAIAVGVALRGLI